jgi:pimeloyl-ACP methyl ester carboxylesterase/ketosteroid isomerase-like protein
MVRAWPAAILCLGLTTGTGGERLGSDPVVRFISRGPSARIEVLDWGGRGSALVFLPGLGNSAHVYEEFAGRFTDRYRVVAITPRGFGASTPTDRGAPLDTVLADIAAVIDTFGLAPATLVGHSLGGDLATFFAARFPGRVARVIYLEGANDRRPGHQQPPRAPWPPLPAMTAADSASDRAYQAYVQRILGPRLPLSDIRATFRFDRQGRLSGGVSSPSVAGVLLGSMGPAPFDSVEVPALAIYSRPDPGRYDMPYWNGLTGAARADADSLQAWFVSSTRANIDSVRRLLRGVEVVEIPRSGHLIFLLTPDETEAAMRRFLDARPAADTTATKAALLAAEAALARAVQARGAAAFLDALEPGAAVLIPGQPILRGTEEARAPFLARYGGASSYSWHAAHAVASTDARFGCTVGFSRFSNALDTTATERHGAYETCWRRGADGQWRIVAHLRQDTPRREPPRTAGETLTNAPHSATISRSRDPRTETQDRDAEFAKTAVDSGTGLAFAKYAAPDVVNLAFMTFGREPLRALFDEYPDVPSRRRGVYVLLWQPIRSFGAGSGGLAFTVGHSVTRRVDGTGAEGHGKFLTIWRENPDGSWSYIFDLGSPRP